MRSGRVTGRNTLISADHGVDSLVVAPRIKESEPVIPNWGGGRGLLAGGKGLKDSNEFDHLLLTAMDIPSVCLPSGGSNIASSPALLASMQTMCL